MSLRDLKNIRLEYKTLSDDVVDNFYIPALQQGVIYKRATGFFSSNILLQISKGLGSLAERNGKMQLLVSPKLEKEDYDAIRSGYDARKLLENKIVENFDFETDFAQKEDRFGMLSYMISSGLLEIKIAVLEENNDKAMYHEKIGIIKDLDDNIIAFSGSANESYNGYNLNYESIDVFCSWTSPDAEQRCNLKELAFNRIWNGSEKGLITIPFPEVIKNKLMTYETSNHNFTKIDDKYREYITQKKNQAPEPYCDEKGLHEYQRNAINEWQQRNFRGIFDMATGTGKTFTGCGAICRLFSLKKRLVSIICCPYTHLVDQWCEEVQRFNIDPIKCYGGTGYETKLRRALTKFKQKRSNFVCIVICNGSFIRKDVQELIDQNINETLLIVDEAHNFGADKISESLNKDYPYRLALSATLDRYGDEIGTSKLYNFFGEKCIVYPLSKAIIEEKLTRYNYHPVIVELTESELDEYIKVSKKIASFHGSSSSGEMPEALKRLLIKRARIVAGAENKVALLKEKIKCFSKDNNILVYCGAVKYGQYGYEDCDDEKKQIQKVVEMLTNDLNMRVSKFTSEENTEQRQALLKSFKSEELQALVAIKCLDEGMNVPAIKTAFILASSTNPKEYIQRRGRVLRNYPGKKVAEIFDFVTLPRNLQTISSLPKDILKIDLSLVKKEMVRLLDFINLSNNPSEGNDIINKIKTAYSVEIIDEGVDEYE